MANHLSVSVAFALLMLPCRLLLAVPPRDALDGESRMEFIDTPLAQIADFLSDQHAVKFALAPSVDGNEGISVHARGRLADLLTMILRPLELEYRIQEDTILIALPRLQALDVSRTQVTDGGLLGLGDLPSLMVVVVEGTRVTPSGIAALRQTAPRVRVLTEPPRCKSKTTAPTADAPVPP